MYSKSDLEQKFGITKNTVRDTLKACGLSTSRREYTSDEVRKFEFARQQIEQGQTYHQVAQHFSVGTKQVDVQEVNAQGAAENSAQESAGDVRMAAFQMANAMADSAMREVAESAMVPLMQFHLGRHMQGGSFASQVDSVCQQIQSGQVGNSQPLLQAGMESLGLLPESAVPALPAIDS